MTSPQAPLAGLKVVEMGQLIAGPFCGQLLGDAGADIVKIEEPRAGDPLRQWGQAHPQGHSLWWAVLGRNKRSVAVDLRTSKGQQIAKDLIQDADILIENFRPGAMERWGMDYATLSATNPGLIMVRVSGFGQTGPYAQRAGYGSIGEAMGGMRYVVGDPDSPPSRVGISIGDTLAATFAALGALTALHERHRSGRGQVVDASIYESVLGVMESLVPDWAVGGVQRERSGSVLPKIAPSNVYPAGDGTWLIIAANQDTVFRRLCTAIDRPELAADSRFLGHHERGAHQAELDDIIAGYTVRFDAEDLEARLTEHGVPVGRIFRPQDMLGDPQFQARESIVSVPHPTLGEVPMQNTFPRFSRTDGEIRWPGPALGEHTAEVLSEHGYSAAEISALEAEEVVR
ncbi:MAG TPA: CoA transferase [Candidatus Nesterenkonia stercoripullorum]|uniref:CoA transferase n=1 Tax=Candidatus Nesterenkonia stercoripullorum TaxID=2838701 RepID=A0A9D1USC7_9MICC|nr:CoA transferase [Candidatus Nesterenkonia stercoripullorum]